MTNKNSVAAALLVLSFVLTAFYAFGWTLFGAIPAAVGAAYLYRDRKPLMWLSITIMFVAVVIGVMYLLFANMAFVTTAGTIHA